MIDYMKGAYGTNLLFRLHGSSMYKAMIPGLLSVVLFLALAHRFDMDTVTTESGGDKRRRHMDSPYAIGVLVTSITFLIVFRANQGYARYWEACGAIHGMMSKLLDATTHVGCFHLQQDHYDNIKPPSYYDHFHLNYEGLSRSRERTAVDNNNGNGNKKRGNKRRKRQSISKVDRARRKSSLMTHKTASCGRSLSRLQSSTQVASAQQQPQHCEEDGGPAAGASPFSYDQDIDRPLLQGEPRLDGGLGLSQEKYPIPPGGHTPPLLLQELAHLSSLVVAVGFCTLRGDIDDTEAFVDLYEPGKEWPKVSGKIHPSSSGAAHSESRCHRRLLRWLRGCFTSIYQFFGYHRTSSDKRAIYFAERPMHVLGGVSDAEIAQLQLVRGASAKTQLCWRWLSEFIVREYLAGSCGDVGSAIMARVMQFLSDGMLSYNGARKIMFIPFPFPSAQISVLCTVTVVWSVPVMLTQYVSDEILGSIIAFFTVTCLVGLHEVGRELENPFRNFPNELPLQTLLAQYNEALLTMHLGYHPDSYFLPQARRQTTPAASADGSFRRRLEETAAASAATATSTMRQPEVPYGSFASSSTTPQAPPPELPLGDGTTTSSAVGGGGGDEESPRRGPRSEDGTITFRISGGEDQQVPGEAEHDEQGDGDDGIGAASTGKQQAVTMQQLMEHVARQEAELSHLKNAVDQGNRVIGLRRTKTNNGVRGTTSPNNGERIRRHTDFRRMSDDPGAYL